MTAVNYGDRIKLTPDGDAFIVQPAPPVDPDDDHDHDHDDGHDHVKPGQHLGHHIYVPDDPNAIILCDGDKLPAGDITASTILICGGEHDFSGRNINWLPYEPNPETDPYGRLGGLVVVAGKVKMHGEPRKSWTRATGGLAKGQTVIELREATDWKPGYEICIGGTQQGPWGGFVDTTEQRVVREVKGKTITVDALEHDHPLAVDPKTRQRFTPGVGLKSHSCVIRSLDKERPGHVLVTGTGQCDFQYVEFADMGRTRADTIDDTIFDADGKLIKFGRNLPGSYTFHAHHPSRPSRIRSCSFHGFRKWGPTYHGASFNELDDCCITDGEGAGIALEMRNEHRNEITNNFICGIRRGTGLGASSDHDGASAVHKEPDTKLGHRTDSSGAFGDAIWCRGVGSNIRGNVGQGCAGWGLNINGYYAWMSGQSEITYQSQPGGPREVTAKFCPPGVVEDNEFGGCRGALWLTWSRVGYEGPDTEYATYRNIVGWHNSMYGVEAYHEGSTAIDGLLLIFDRTVSNSYRGSKTVIASNSNRMSVGMQFHRYHFGRPRLTNIRIYGPTVGIIVNPEHIKDVETHGKSVISGEIEARLGVYFPEGSVDEWDLSGLTWRHNGEAELRDKNPILAEPKAVFAETEGINN